MNDCPPELLQLRKELDHINKELLVVLIKRFSLLDQVCEVKAGHRLPVYDPDREGEMLQALPFPLENEPLSAHVKSVFSKVLEESLGYCRKIRGPN